MDQTTLALQEIERALAAPQGRGVAVGNWRWEVRQRMARLRDALAREWPRARDGWLVAREGSVLRERNALLARLAALGTPVLESPDVDAVTGELRRLLRDVDRHLQRRHDLAYDDVEIELGGSE